MLECLGVCHKSANSGNNTYERRDTMSIKKSIFEQRMRDLESVTNLRLHSQDPIVIRVDGKGFHAFHTAHFGEHFSMQMQTIMNATMKYVIEQLPDIDFAYTNSDEITFICMPKPNEQYSYNGRILKLSSIIASMVSSAFNQKLGDEELAIFDARVFNVDNLSMVKDVLTWRQSSGKRNTISTFAREHMSASAMKGYSTIELEKILLDAGYTIPRNGFYYGYFISRKIPQLVPRIAHGDINEIVDVYLDQY